jgi:hypothetical protein
MKFDTKAESPKLFFKAMRWLTEEEYAIAVEKGQSPEAKQAITMTVAQMDKVPAPMTLEGTPPKAAMKPAPTPAPAPEPAPAPAAVDDGDEAPPPAPRRGRPPKAVVEARKAAEAAAEEPPEPVVQRTPAPPRPAMPTQLAKLAEDWDDE